MDDMRQHISLSRRWNNIVKLRLCNMAAERYRQSTRPRGSNEPRGRFSVSKNLRGKLFYPKTVPIFVSLRGAQRRGNLKVEGVASRGEAREHEARGNPYHKKHRFAASFRFRFLHSNALFRYGKPYFVPG